ncbi:outer membrane beta-barrel protein [Ensifer canadensis]
MFARTRSASSAPTRATATRGGLEVDLGEKLYGEIALGYETYRFEDDRLERRQRPVRRRPASTGRRNAVRM